MCGIELCNFERSVRYRCIKVCRFEGRHFLLSLWLCAHDDRRYGTKKWNEILGTRGHPPLPLLATPMLTKKLSRM